MKTEIKIKKEVELKTLIVMVGVRYYNDSEVNGKSDTEEGDLIPCKVGDLWCPIIDIDSGVITNWETGKTADIHYKVCDQFSCDVLDEKGEIVFQMEDEYVPKIMCPKDSGYGDYIIMDIDERGKIIDWDKEDILDLIESNTED